ncbi:MAG: VPLPA-CTERM sorting domain-containing protein [Gammaproteobacteria bacterium]|nr:VPLPA-CTERM sorting domain-containing protein [Gammaproteobacteria bacterium]
MTALVSGISNAASIENSSDPSGNAGVWAFSPIGQSFVANGTQLQSIAFSFYQLENSAGDGLITMTLYSGSGFGGAVLGSETLLIDSSTLPISTFFGTNFIDFDFTGTSLTIGQTYTAGVSSSDQKVAVAYGPEAYAGGQLFQTPLYSPLTNCNPSSLCDLNFRVQTVVPLPAAVWLFGSALGVMGWMRRKLPT